MTTNEEIAEKFLTCFKDFFDEDGEKGFEGVVDKFAAENLHIFAEDFDFTIEGESKLEYSECHKRFQELMEKCLDGIVEKMGVSQEKLMEALEDKRAENAMVNMYIYLIQGYTDYAIFLQLMGDCRNASDDEDDDDEEGEEEEEKKE